MTIDTTKITPEKLAEMNDSLITDNNHLRQRVAEVERLRADAARLDYLQQGVTVDLVGKELLFRIGGLNSTMRTTIREAIDAALSEPKGD